MHLVDGHGSKCPHVMIMVKKQHYCHEYSEHTHFETSEVNLRGHQTEPDYHFLQNNKVRYSICHEVEKLFLTSQMVRLIRSSEVIFSRINLEFLFIIFRANYILGGKLGKSSLEVPRD